MTPTVKIPCEYCKGKGIILHTTWDSDPEKRESRGTKGVSKVQWERPN
jgi:hypothetical protein